MGALIWLVGVSLTCLTAGLAYAAAPELKPAYGKAVARGKTNGAPRVWLFKQWHPAPGVDLRSSASERPIPQQTNQTAIYEQLDAWITAGSVQSVVAEGCAGEITAGFQPKFNGWDLAALKAKAKEPGYAQLVSSVPLKLEAKHGDRVQTLCGDDDELIQKNNLAFSDARGTLGFLTRLEQYRNDEARAKTYLEGARQILKLPADAPASQVIPKLRAAIKADIARARDLIEQRNAHVVSRVQVALAGNPKHQAAIVFGGVHADGIAAGLDRIGVPFVVVEPVGYDAHEANLFKRLDELLK